MVQNVTDTWDDIDEGEEIPQGNPMVELGVTGVRRVGGYVEEEFLPALRGRKAVKIYKEMSHNDSMVGALLFAIDKLIRQVKWEVRPGGESPEHKKAAQFVESCMEDMSESWDDFIGEVLSVLTYGWSWHEVVYKRRMGPWEKDPKKKSKFNDGMVGWRKIPIRSQETLHRWVFDEKGGVRAMVQMAPPKYTQTVLPIEKSLLFRTNLAKGNPEGFSLLRTAYRSWYFKKRLEEFEAIGVERDLAGMPVGRVPSAYLNAKPGTPQRKTVDAFRRMVRGVRRDENEGLVLPLEYDQDTKQPLFDFELMSAGGSRQFDTNSLIQRYEQRILMSVLADFILVGHQEVGSYALHTDKTGIFRAALSAITKSIADTLNRHALPRLFEANGWKMDELPYFDPQDVDPPDLTQLAQFVSATAGAGMQWFPDPELEKFLRETAKLPELPPDEQDYRDQMYDQHRIMEYAQSQMGLLGMQQKAEMASSGMTPEQAEMQAQAPNPQMQVEQAQGEAAAQDVQAAEQAKLTEQYGDQDPERAKTEQEAERLALKDQFEERKFERQTKQQKMKEQAAKKTTPAKKTAAKKTTQKPKSKQAPEGARPGTSPTLRDLLERREGRG